MTSGDILRQATDLYRGGEANYRDSMLQVGRLLHEYVLARLSEADELPEPERLALGLTRAKILKEVEAAMGLSRKRANDIIAGAMVAHILAPGGNLGTLSHGAIFRFRVFVERNNGGSGCHPGRPGEPVISDQEIWVIKPKLEKIARRLFARAVSEEWKQETARAEVLKAFPIGPRSHQRKPADDVDDDSPHDDRHQRSFEAASPGDLVDEIVKMIDRSEDPEQVTLILRARLERMKFRRKTAV